MKYVYTEQLRTTLRIAEKVNGQPSETTQHRMKREKNTKLQDIHKEWEGEFTVGPRKDLVCL